jgi:hypothetical protein
MKMNRKQGGVLALLLAVLAAITAWRFCPGM